MMYLVRGLGSTVTDLINADAAKYGIDPRLLLSVAQHESSLNPNALGPPTSSGQRAQGIMQLMPATAAQFGVSNPFDPAQNIDAGAHYFSQLLAQYGGDTFLALAAYNAGPGNVAKYGGIPPFPETQNYVSSIMGDLGGSDGSVSASFPTDSGPVFDPGMPVDTSSAGLSTTAMVGLGIAGLALLWAVAS